MSELETAPQEQSGQPQEVETVTETAQDNVQEVASQEPQEQASEVEVSEGADMPSADETFLYTYKSKEEAEKGIAEKDAYIEKLKADLQAKQTQEQEVYKQLGYQNQQQFQNAQVEQQLQGQYQNELAYVEQAYNIDLITLNNALDNGQMSEFDYNNQVAQLQQAKVNFLAEAKANDRYRRSQAQQQAQTAQQQAFEQQKNSLYETHKEHKELIDLFYDNQPTIEKAIAMKQAIATQAVEAYKASLLSQEQNTTDISKLPKADSATVTVQPKADYTAAELAVLQKENPEAFKKWCNS